MFGEDMVGLWVSKTDMETLNEYMKPLIKDALDATGFDNISAYLWGDELTKLRGFLERLESLWNYHQVVKSLAQYINEAINFYRENEMRVLYYD